MTAPPDTVCDECGSRYHAGASAMAALCPECAHRLYGYPNCPHAFANGRCRHCGWDGSRTDMTAPPGEDTA